MKKNKPPLILICTLMHLLFCSVVFSQKNPIDSLSALLKNEKNDSNKTNHLNALAFALYYSNPDSTILLGEQEAELAGKINFPAGIANGFSSEGVGYWAKGDYPHALDCYFKALKIDQQFNNKKGIATRFGNIGIVYEEQGDYPKALDYYFKALEMEEKLKNKSGIERHLGNIGVVYDDQADYPKALDYYFKALEMAGEVRDKNGIARHLGNIGNVYYALDDYSKALEYYFKAKQMNDEIGDRSGVEINLGNIGSAYKLQGDSAISKRNTGYAHKDRYPKALDYCFQALRIATDIGDQNGISRHTANIGALYIDMKNYKDAEKYLLEALELDKKIGALNNEIDCENNLTNLYTATHRFQDALEHYRNQIKLNDSIFSQEKNKEITRKEMNYEFEKKETAIKAAQDQKDAVAGADARKQKIILWLVIGGLLLVVVFSGFIYRSLTLTRSQKKIIELKSRETELQKIMIEEKNKGMLDSIHYAKRIQQSLLPTEKYIQRSLDQLRRPC